MAEEIVAAHYRTGASWRVTFQDAVMRRVEPVDAPAEDGLILAPALVDIQVNGFGGIDFNAPGLQPGDVRAATRMLARHGVAHYLPTIITGPLERMRANAAAIAAAARQYPEVRAALWGIHVEGPFLSEREGARGAHDLRWIRPPDEGEFAAVQDAAGGAVALVTLAPEREGAPEFMRRRVAEGIVVAIGHTTAGPHDVARAVEAGATLSTHLGNGCETLLPRHENPVTLQLGCDELWASFIADGHHLPPYLLQSFLRAKGVARSILTTDCMAAAGAPPGRYTIGELQLEVGADGVVRHPGHDGFAGSALTLDRAVANVVAWGQATLLEAIEMASLQPARLLGRAATFAPEASGSFIVAAQAPRFAIRATLRRSD